MKLAIAALALLPASAAAVAEAQTERPNRAAIPAQFHGRWAENQAACRTTHFTTVITIDRRGWSSFEEGGRVSRAGQVRRGTHYFRVNNYVGGEESTGSLAMRRDGPRIVMTFAGDDGQTDHYSLIRCR